jgi:anti-sigma B factor antagonist
LRGDGKRSPRGVGAVSVPPFRATAAELGSGLGLVSVSGELDLYVERDLRDALAAADGLGLHTVVVDLSGASFMDSTICGILVGEAKRRRSSDGDLVLVSNGTRTSRVLEVAGIDRVIRMFPTLHAALEEMLLEPAQ